MKRSRVHENFAARERIAGARGVRLLADENSVSRRPRVRVLPRSRIERERPKVATCIDGHGLAIDEHLLRVSGDRQHYRDDDNLFVRLLRLRNHAAGAGAKLSAVLQTRGARLCKTIALDLKFDEILFSVHTEAVVAVGRCDVEEHFPLANTERLSGSKLSHDGRPLRFYGVQVDGAAARCRLNISGGGDVDVRASRSHSSCARTDSLR